MPVDSQLRSLLQRWDDLRDRGETPTPEELCRDCPERVDEVRSLLRDLRALDPPGDTPPDLGATPEAAPADGRDGLARPAAFAGSRYRPLRFHARGGQGEVYLARDETLGRDVALKRVQERHGGRAEMVRRFVREAEVCGRLQHPGIVPVYDLGRDADGQPYYAMRFIEGEALSEAIGRFHGAPANGAGPRFGTLEFRQLLTRFVAACNAVAYAHSKGVIHRDIKPGNVMLGPYGETLVVDWGLAKVIGRDGPSDGPDAPLSGPDRPGADGGTLTGDRIGTPAYMSPEQARGDVRAVGPAADVYSLGATLYTLLTGSAPFTGDNVLAVLDRVRGGGPVPPRQRAAGVPAALGAVCLKALALRPDDRYASATELAAEVERWLADEPVAAYREPWPERLRRWGRRHRPLVAGAAALVLTAAVGLGLLALERERARETVAKEQAETARERDEKGAALLTAEKRLGQVERGIEILGSVFTNLDPRAEKKEGKPLRYLLGQQLDRATAELEGEAVGDAVAVARLQRALGLAQLNLGSPWRAIELFAKARITFAARLGPDHPDTLLTMHNLAVGYHKAGELAGAVSLLEETLALSKAKLGPDHPDTLNVMSSLATCYSSVGTLDRALPLYEQTLRLKRAKLGPDHPDTLVSMNNLAAGYRAAGKLDRVVALYEDALALIQAKLGPDHPDTLNVTVGLAVSYYSVGKLDRALTLLEETLRLQTTKLGPDHPNTLVSMDNLAGIYHATGKLDRALPLWEETLKLQKARLGPDHPETLRTVNNLAGCYRAVGRLDKALPLYEQTLALRKAKLGPDHPDTLDSMNDLAVVYYSTGDLDRALPLWEETLRLQTAKLGPDHPDSLVSMNNLAYGYESAGRLDKALPLYERTLALRKAKLGPDHPHTLVSMNNLGQGYHSAGRLDLALPLWEETLQLRKAKLGPDHPDTLLSMHNLALGYQTAGKLDLAVPLFEETLTLRRAKLGPEHPDTLTTMNNLAVALLAAKQPGKAIPLLQQFLGGQKKRLGESPRLAALEASVALALIRAGEAAAAEPIARECLVTRERRQPDDWATFSTKSLLGGALAGQKKYGDAEPLLLQGYEGMKRRAAKIPAAGQARLAEAAERLVQLYEATDKPGEAARWRKEVEAAKADKPPKP